MELEPEFEHAQYELDRATNREEYEYAREIFDDIKGRLDQTRENYNIAKEIVDRLEVDVPTLKQAYDDAEQTRKDTAEEIKQAANIDVPEFDPKNGPPTLPEDEDASSTAAGSGDGSSTDGSTDGSGSGGSGSGGSGGAGAGSSG